jgi:hypothetical protein
MTTRSTDPHPIIPILCILALTSAACSDRPATNGSELLPAQLHGLQLVESHSGEEAAATIADLHKQDVAATETEIGIYGSEEMRAELYVSVFQSTDEAATQFEAMVDAITAGVPGYGHHTHFDVEERDVHIVFGDGKINYFFGEGERLSWLGANPTIARAALADLLEVDVNLIPELPGMGR